ncbi:ABC transporter permease [Chromatiales bacterium (ex Bugula neritina AB1)]|nr:ABC transporter permease [Chromatiales bacterium (ex Bugula neritina AB1)]
MKLVMRVVGLSFLLTMVTLAVIGPQPLGLNPAKQSLRHTLTPPGTEHILGTDHLGRDMAARIIAGAQLSLSLALLAVVSAAIPGTVLGIVSAWRGGWTELLINALCNAILALPGLLLVLLLAAISPGSWWALYVGISLTLWVEYYRYSRERSRTLLSSSAVEASRLLGFGPIYILRRHLLPELLPKLLTLAAFGVASSVTAMAALGFVSVGIRPPTAEWGVMMTELLPYWREAPWLIAQPVACLVLTVLAVHLIAGHTGDHR